jgi:arylsulfatase A-like enzyme/Tfp pilus assembly protein PilF
MKRRVVVALAAVAVLAVALWWLSRTPGFAIAPNADRDILLVTIDTLRADAVGSYGGRAVTPTLDALAERGARFEFAHAHAVVTLPSHASILTGRYPYEHGIRDNTGYRLDPAHETAATLLKKHGFATAAFIGGFPLDHRFGLNAGFDLYDDRLTPGGDAAERERRADAVVAGALEWIDRQRGKWFAWVHLYDPHVLYEPPADWAQRFPSDPYLGEVSWTDAALAPLVDRLRSRGRPTLVIVTADHGEGLGDHDETTHGIFAYESTLRVPLIVAELGGAARDVRGATISTPVRHVDLLPTLLEAAAGAPGRSGAGSSLLPVINDGDDADRPMYFEAMTAALTRGWAPLRGVVAGREKYIDLPIPELYDLAADRKETGNLAGARPERVRAMLNLLRNYNVAPPARAQAESAETIERLRSLGYIAGSSAEAKATYTEDDDPKRLIELERMLERAAAAFRQGRADEAIEIYRGVIARRKDTEDAYRKLALVYWRTGRPQMAIETLETALRNGVRQKEVRNRLAQYFAETGQPRRAIALLEHDAGSDPDALIALGNAYLLAGRSAEALKTFQHLLSVDPANALAYENMGAVHLQARDYKEAELALRRALALNPALPGAWTALGVVFASTDRKDEAIEAWKRALQLDPNEANARFNLQKFVRREAP